ncbi:MAG TPA: hypothetical protein VHQ20_01195 [Patescibacteria group bacterium]|jgi:hypothetical protein|nr:hypothetical protein [Patescibacteria group bacterium]
MFNFEGEPNFDPEELASAQEAKETLSERLKDFDFDRQKLIFESILKPSSRTDKNILGKENVLTHYDAPEILRDLLEEYKAGAVYSPDTNQVYIDPDNLKLKNDVASQLRVFHVLNHEFTHGLSKVECAGFQIANTSGFYKSKNAEGEEGQFFELFNEAITEKIGREVTERYIESDSKREDYEEVLGGIYKTVGYEPFVLFVDQFVDLISEKTGVSREVVWDGVKNSFLNGEDLFDSEIKEEFESTFHKGLIEELSEISSKKEAQAILNKMEYGPNTNIFTRLITKLQNKFDRNQNG